MAAAAIPLRSAPQQRPRALHPQRVAAEPRLSVVVVNYCQWKNTTRLAKQLRQSLAARRGHAEIVIIDNHSPRHRLIARLRRAEGISVRRFKRNRGFARAVNEGCRLSRGQWFLLLNPDTSVPTGFLDRVAEQIEKCEIDNRIGVIGLGVRNADGSAQPSCGRAPTLFGTIAGLFLPRSRRKCKALAAQQQIEVAWATGCALLIRKECLLELGGFDEDFFLYYEDADFCRRAKDLGWKVCFEPSLFIMHHSPLHARKVSAPLRFVTRHALLTYGVKHWSRLQSTLLGGLIWLEAAARQCLAWWNGRADDAHFHGQTRAIVGNVLGARQSEISRVIRITAEHLAVGAFAEDGKTK
jgi:N-acetylglucosaminyl-diphospho-decaprenol L-rhamnosyltransferase